jgi:hypothetical protein
MGTFMNTAITFKDVEFDIQFEFTPEIVEDDNFGYSAQVDIDTITHNGVEFYEIMVPYIVELEELILDKLCEST